MTSTETNSDVREALEAFCEAHHVGGPELATLLKAPYSTVASWAVSPRSRRKPKFRFTKGSRTLVEDKLPFVVKWVRQLKSPQYSQLLPRRRVLTKESWWPEAEKAIALRLKSLDVSFLPEGGEEIKEGQGSPVCLRRRSYYREPWLEVERLRHDAKLGTGPIADVDDAVERLQHRVVRTGVGSKPWSTLIKLGQEGWEVFVFATGGPTNEPAQRRASRHGLLVELGFGLIGTTTRASAKHHFAIRFADEFLLPLPELTRLLLTKRPVSAEEVEALAAMFGIPTDAVERQCKRAKIKVAGKSGRAVAQVTHLGFREHRLTPAAAFHEMPAPPSPVDAASSPVPDQISEEFNVTTTD